MDNNKQQYQKPSKDKPGFINRVKVKTISILTLAALGSALLVSPAAAAPLIKGGFSSPLDPDSYHMTSAYGPRCQPIMYSSTHHNGQDMGTTQGSPIYAIADGTVVRAQPDRVAGQWILIQHRIDGRNYFSSISHTLDAQKYVKQGTRVKKGQRVAQVGSTGVSTAPHLHLEIWRDAWNTGTHLDPVTFLKGKGIDLAANAISSPQLPTPKSCTYYSYGAGTVYSQPSVTSNKVTTTKNNATVRAVPKDKNKGFLEVTANGKKGWMHESNLSPKKANATEGGAGATTANGLNMRKGPGTGHGIITSLGYGTRIQEVLDYSNGWYRVKANNKTGWVSGSYVTMAGGSKDITKPPTPTTPPVTNGFFITNDFVKTQPGFEFGNLEEEYFVGDWNGDGRDTLAYRRGTTFHIRNSNTSGSPTQSFQYGKRSDEILVGDWNGNGKDSFAVRRGNKVWFKNSLRTGGRADHTFKYGKGSDTFLVGDWNGDGKDTIGIRRGNEYWFKNHLRTGGKSDLQITYGRPDEPNVLIGDWNGDGKDTLSVRRGNQYRLKTVIRTGGGSSRVVNYGKSTDNIFVGDWNGNGKDSVATLRK